MAIKLEKGGRINLSKENANLKRVRVGLAWDARVVERGDDYDLDASVFVCKLDASSHPKLIADEYFVFYNNRETPDKAVEHSGDNRSGSGDGDDETIIVNLPNLHPEACELSFIVTIHKAEERKQSFGEVKNSRITLYNDETGDVVAKYSLEEEFSKETAVQFGSLYKRDGQWLFKAVGAGFNRGLIDFVRAYGGNV